MDVIRLEVQHIAHGHIFATIFVNDRPLLELMREAKRPYIAPEDEAFLTRFCNDVVPTNILLPSRLPKRKIHHLWQRYHWYNPDTETIVLFQCTCGEPYCAFLRVRIQENDDTVTWSDFGPPNHRQDSALVQQQFYNLGPFVFGRQQYEQAITAAQKIATDPTGPVYPKMVKEWLEERPLLQAVIKTLQDFQLEAYLVGGTVRDFLLAREPLPDERPLADLDFAVPGDGLAVARRVANALDTAFYPLDAERGTGRVVIDSESTYPPPTYLDFATWRGTSLLADLADRDFTVNAIAMALVDPFELIDPLQGQHDLELGQIRAVSAHAFERDPVRVLRAIRQAAELGFTIEAQTEQYLRETAATLPQVSPERQRDELLKLLNVWQPGQAVQELRRLEVLPHVLPEIEAMVGVSQGLPHYLDVFEHTITALNEWNTRHPEELPGVPYHLRLKVSEHLNQPLAGHVTRQSLLPLALLLHDTGKPATRIEERVGDDQALALTETEPTISKVRFLGHEQISAKIARQVMQRLHFSSQATDFVETVVAYHMRPLLLANEGQVTRRGIYRFFRDTGEAGVAVALHALADHRATYPEGQGQAEWHRLAAVVDKLLTAYLVDRTQMVDPPLLLTGHDLIKTFGLAEGRLIGVLLGRLKEAQATGEVTDKITALAFVSSDPDFVKRKPSRRQASH
jgi:tRNA nucleotidyltransferase/poly(A) polymerase